MSKHIKNNLKYTTILGLTLLAACAGQTPLANQEPFRKPEYVSSYAEDRVTLKFAPGQSQLNADQVGSIERFLTYYKTSKDSAFFVSVLRKPEEVELGVKPYHDPAVVAALQGVLNTVAGQDIKVNVIEEVEADAVAAVPAATPSAKPADAPTVTRKIAVIVRQYDIRAANCPHYEGWDWRTAKPHSKGNITGCAVNKALLAQVKDKTSLIQGKPMNPAYASDYDVVKLKEVYTGTFEAEGDASVSVESSN